MPYRFTRLSELPTEDKEVYVRLAFPGFREDTHCDKSGKPLSQHAREEKLKADGYPGAG
jgi:hypothetical protein